MLSQKKHCRPSRRTYDSEILLKQVKQNLVRDLSPHLPVPFNFDENHGEYPFKCNWDTYRFKVVRQLENFTKRVIFSTDKTHDELHDITINDFISSQLHYGVQRLTPCTILMLNEARRICHDILSDFDFDTFSSLCGPGKRAAFGLPYSKSYLDNRFAKLTGTQKQFQLMKAVYLKDIRLHRLLRRSMKNAVITDHVVMTSVPKSFKINRLIAPDTVIGGFLSRGLGAYIRLRLEEATHIRLSDQALRHRHIAEQSSVNGKMATIDMSKASDSLNYDILAWVLPDQWMHYVETMRTPLIKINGELHPYTTQMLMGSGHTFPLQTLIFYCLCKAVCRLLSYKGKIDVYGDDIIIPSWTYEYVSSLFSNIGLTVNNEKSFFEGSFRESCGGDYHHGIDVRPFQPELKCDFITHHSYTALIHKLYNGLLERWSVYEIPTTLSYLLTELIDKNGGINVVPRHEGVESGIFDPLPSFLPYTNLPTHDKTTQCLSYWKLSRKGKKRKPHNEGPYAWYWLYNCQYQMLPDIYDCIDSGSLVKGLESRKGSTEERWCKV